MPIINPLTNKRLSPQEQAAFVALYYLLLPAIKELGKPARREYLAASEALAAFKEGSIDEITCIHLLATSGFTEIKNKQGLMEMFTNEGQIKVNNFWNMLRKWANLPIFNSLVGAKEFQQDAQQEALAYWGKVKAAQEEKESGAVNKLKAKMQVADLTEQELETLMKEDEDAYFLACELALERVAAAKIKINKPALWAEDNI